MITDSGQEVLAQRLRVAERRIAAEIDALIPPLGDTRGRPVRAAMLLTAGLARTGALVLVLLVAVVAAYSLGFGGAGKAALPTGLFVPDKPSGTDGVEAIACVAIRLDDDSIAVGNVTVFWWTTGSEICSPRVSGITTQSAVLSTVTLEAVDDMPQRTGYRVSFQVGAIPSGTHEIAFALDPDFARRDGLALAAVRQGETKPTLTFTRVETLTIPGPDDDGPVATPQQASPP